MIRRLPEPSRSQWKILEALAQTGALTLRGGRFVASETPARSFAFTPVMHLVPRGLARVIGDGAQRVEPTALCHRVLAARAAASAPIATAAIQAPSEEIRA